MSKSSALVCILVLIAASAGAVVLADHDDGGPASDTVTVEDMLGEKVEVKRNPESVACISRTTYDLLVAFGLGDRIDGVYHSLLDNSWTSVLYPGASEHYSYDYNPSYELLLERGVDLVLCPEKYITDGYREHGVAALNVSLYGNPDFGGYVYFMADLAEALWPDVDGVADKAEAWKSQLGSVIGEVTDSMASAHQEERSVYYIRGDKYKGIGYTDTGGSLNEYVFGLLGMDYLGRELGTSRPSTEALLDADPDVIVIGGTYQYTLYNELVSDATWENIRAVMTGCIYHIGMGFSPMEQMGVFTPVFIADMANKLHPDIFGFDASGMLKALCSEYFGVELSDDQASYMLAGLGPDGSPMA